MRSIGERMRMIFRREQIIIACIYNTRIYEEGINIAEEAADAVEKQNHGK